MDRPSNVADFAEQAALLQRSAHISVFHRRGAVYLYHDVFGYLLQASADIVELLDAFLTPIEPAHIVERSQASLPEVATFIDILAQHRCLVTAGSDELAALDAMCPVRGRWSIVQKRRDGGLQAVWGRNVQTPPQLHVMSALEQAVWRRCDGNTTVRDIARQVFALSDPPDDSGQSKSLVQLHKTTLAVRAVVASFVHSERQWARVSQTPVSFYRAGRRRPPYLDSTMPYPRLDPAEVPGDPFERDGIVDLREYHRESIEDAAAQFDLGETTLFHMFQDPHEALAGKGYAEALVDALASRGMLGDGTADVLEVGGGTGAFARGVLDALRSAHPNVYAGLRYQVADISPALQESQSRHIEVHRDVAQTITTDAEALDLPDASVDLLLCNEVIADLRTAHVLAADLDPVARLTAERVETSKEALDALQRYELPVHDADGDFYLNIGAFVFLEQVERVLRPGGAAFVSEFGDLWRYPVESTQLDHPEFSIHFGHLRHVAQRLGMQAEVVDVMTLLGMDPDIQTMAATRTWFRNLAWLMQRSGVPLQKRAYTRETLQALCGERFDYRTVPSIRFGPLGERVLGLRAADFKALLLRKKPE